MPIVDTHAFGETVVKLGRFIIRFSNIDAANAKASTSKSSSLVLFFPTLFSFLHSFLHFLHYLTEKNKKRYSTDDTVADENQFKISRQTRCVFCRSLSSWSLFSSLVARVSMVCCASSFYISLEKEELFYSDDYSRAKSARDDAARSASFFEC